MLQTLSRMSSNSSEQPNRKTRRVFSQSISLLTMFFTSTYHLPLLWTYSDLRLTDILYVLFLL